MLPAFGFAIDVTRLPLKDIVLAPMFVRSIPARSPRRYTALKEQCRR